MTMKVGRLTEARTHCDNIFRACDAVDCPLALLSAMSLKATCHVHGNNFDAAEQLFNQSLAGAVNLAREIEAHPEWQETQAQWLQQNADSTHTAILTKRSDTITRVDVLKQQGSCHTGLAAVARHKGNLEAAVASSKLAMGVARDMGDRSLEASALSALGAATFHIDKCASADSTLNILVRAMRSIPFELCVLSVQHDRRSCIRQLARCYRPRPCAESVKAAFRTAPTNRVSSQGLT
jgi:hypothetical protein